MPGLTFYTQYLLIPAMGDDVNGGLEISNVNGPITVMGVEGSVLANTVNGKIEVVGSPLFDPEEVYKA